MKNARLPARLAPVAFGLIVSGIMSFMVSGVSTWLAVGEVSVLLSVWPTKWLKSWLVAFPTILVVAPFVRRFVAKISEPPSN